MSNPIYVLETWNAVSRRDDDDLVETTLIMVSTELAPVKHWFSRLTSRCAETADYDNVCLFSAADGKIIDEKSQVVLSSAYRDLGTWVITHYDVDPPARWKLFT